jgi:hypothetical protein
MLTQLASFLSFSALDKTWGHALTSSALLGWLVSLFNAIRANFAEQPSVQLAPPYSNLAFALSCLLFLVLALPQFANDKGALALLSTAAMVLWIVGRLAGGKEERQFSAVDALVSRLPSGQHYCHLFVALSGAKHKGLEQSRSLYHQLFFAYKCLEYAKETKQADSSSSTGCFCR